MRSSLLDWSITSEIENYPEYRWINIEAIWRKSLYQCILTQAHCNIFQFFKTDEFEGKEAGEYCAADIIFRKKLKYSCWVYA